MFDKLSSSTTWQKVETFAPGIWLASVVVVSITAITLAIVFSKNKSITSLQWGNALFALKMQRADGIQDASKKVSSQKTSKAQEKNEAISVGSQVKT